jgi:predicted nucleic acid-binding protein
VSVYLDASILVALFTADSFSSRADRFLHDLTSSVVISDFAAAEFVSALAKLIRMRQINRAGAQRCLSDFDTWTRNNVQRADTVAAGVKAADTFLRRLDLPLRTPDALNIAITVRIGAKLATFDTKMASSARSLGCQIVIV